MQSFAEKFQAEHLAIDRKIGASDSSNCVQLETWTKALYAFTKALGSTAFGAVIVDYDGTLVDTESRSRGPSSATGAKLVQFLEAGVLLGIATGRGKSVRMALERCIPSGLRHRVWIGYYNAGIVAPLSDSSIPVLSEDVVESLREAVAVLESNEQLRGLAKLTKRPLQITIEADQTLGEGTIWNIVSSALAARCSEPPKVVASSHSVDVLATGVSKLNLVRFIKDNLGRDCAQEVLCIGDRGRWPGNDFELLAQPYSLSVDDVSPDLTTCWNLASLGKRGPAAFLEYTDWMQLAPKAARMIIPTESS